MPSMKRLFFFAKKKNQGPKFHEFHGYDNLRHSAYPMSPNQHPPPPPHSFSQRHQLYPQQVLPQPQPVITQCQCQQCSYQQQTLSQQPSQVQIISQPQLQPQQQQQQQQLPPPQIQQCQQQQPYHYPNTQHYVSQTTQLPTPTVAQCICQHCPYQQQQTLAGQQMQLTQVNGTCQHLANQIQPVQQPMHQQYHAQQTHTVQQTLMGPSHPPQLVPVVLQPITPALQHHQQQQQQQPPIQLQPQQFQCHTIQPQQQHQQQKQQQQHQRVQSMHQQSQPAFQSHSQPQLIVQSQHQIQHQEPQMESQSESHDFSRYANMQSLLDDSLHTQTNSQPKYQEHVYSNQKFTLPTYEAPPNYSTFMRRKRASALELNGQHMTYHGESFLRQTTKDSSYENLRTFSNLGIGKQEPGYTS